MIVTLALVALSTISLGDAITSWPRGRYCLPMPPSQQCPSGWSAGYRNHDTEDRRGSCCCSRKRYGSVPYNSELCRNLGWGFCCKTHWAGYRKQWPKGSYCIFRYGGSCPSGFGEGYVQWDDEDRNNRNGRSGVLPDGIYGRNTRIYFCCRNDRRYYGRNRGRNRLYGLPYCRKIVLMRYKGTCPAPQRRFRGPYTGYLQWDTEDRKNRDAKSGYFPDGQKTFGSGIKIEFCSYTSFGNRC